MPPRPCSQLVAALVVAALALPACRRSGPPPASPVDPLVTARAVVDDFRRVIALMANDEADERATTAAWMIAERNRERSEALAARLAGDAAATTAFLGWLETEPSLRDADKLAFRDLLEELPPGPRVAQDRQALGRIAERYDEELRKVAAALGRATRGLAERRESWEAYVAFVRSLHPPEAVVGEFRADLDGLSAGARGAGGAVPWRDDKDQVTGRRLPEKTVLLTFDDGPSAKQTPAVLEILKRYGAPAVFFTVGKNVGRSAEATKKIEEAGHTLANHSWSHAFLPKLRDADLRAQLADTNQALAETAGHAPILFRPPYGARTEKVLSTASELGMKTVLWNVDSLDWSDPVPASIAHRVLASLDKEKRGIVLFHDIHERTVKALPLVLEGLAERGYSYLRWDGKDLVSARGPANATPVKAAGTEAGLYRESWAVVIGINAYQSWPKLAYAVRDAEAVRDLLVERYGFAPDHVTMLRDGEATRERILAALGDELADGRKVQRDDRVVVFFAGHGVTRRLPSGKMLGYLVPVDADAKNYQSQAISMTNFQDASEAIAAKHVFFIMDACYSGLALTRGASGAATGDRRQYLAEITRRSARQVLTAGGADEQVADNGPGGHSIFTWTLLQGLEGKADLDADGAITATELAAYVAPAVSSVSRQTPAFGHLAGSEGGELVFLRRTEGEFLSDESRQLDAEGVRLAAELERMRKLLDEKRARNQRLSSELEATAAALRASASAVADAGVVALAEAPAAGAAPATTLALASDDATKARREVDRGMALYREQRYDEAAAAFAAATALDPRNALAANNLGFAYAKLGRWAEAVTWYEKTLALDPRRAVAHLNAGDAYLQLERKADARRAYEAYLSLQPSSKQAAAVREKLAALP